MAVVFNRKIIIVFYTISLLTAAGFLGIFLVNDRFDCGTAKGQTIIVDSSGGGGNYSKIQDAIDNASALDTIFVWAGVYNENIKIGKSLTIIGNGTGDTILNGSSAEPIIYTNADGVRICGLTVKKGSGTISAIGMKLDYARNITVENCSFVDCGRDIYLYYAHDNIIRNNSCSGFFRGVYLYGAHNNVIENNTCLKKYYAGIDLEYSDYNEVLNNSCSSTDNEGVNIEQSHYNLLYGNNVSNGRFYGIHLYYANCNNLFENTCDNNSYYGIFIERSSDNNITNNTCTDNRYCGIDFHYLSSRNTVTDNIINGGFDGFELYGDCNDNYFAGNVIIDQKYTGVNNRDSQRNTFDKNTFTRCGFDFEGNTLEEFRSHEMDTNNTVNGKPVYFLKDASNLSIPAGAGQVILVNCTGITLENQNLSAATEGAELAYSSDCVVANNTFTDNGQTGVSFYETSSSRILNNTCRDNYFGIRLWGSDGNLIQDNLVRDTVIWGIALESSENCRVIKNTCINNSDGIFSQGSSANMVIDNNTCNYNRNDGIEISYSYKNTTVQNNICKHNTNDGIDVSLYEGRVLKNYCARNNWSGIFVRSTRTQISNNFAEYNNQSGLRVMAHESNITENGLESNSDAGLLLDGILIFDAYSMNNYIFNNEIYKNVNGIRMNLADINWLYENQIIASTGYGILAESTSKNSKIYHNKFYSNAKQGKDDGINYFNNSLQQGNYWSDYSGADNGAGGRTAGDGIGDTVLPHSGVDYYPYIFSDGWEKPSRPYLTDPGAYTVYGDYNLSWNSNNVSKGFILQEAVDNLFTAPSVIYDGPARSYEIENKSDGIYYYRVRAYAGAVQTGWSNVVDISVDRIPQPPSGLTVLSATGSTVSLQWSPPPDTDLLGYDLWMNDTGSGISGSYHRISTLSPANTQYTITHLDDQTAYHFYITCFDKYSNSSISNKITATTDDETSPAAPSGLTAKALNDKQVQLDWDENLEPDLAGYLVYMNASGFGPDGEFDLLDTLTAAEISYTVSGLTEQTTYYFKLKAFDKIPNESPFSATASATTPDITKPTKPGGLAVTTVDEHTLKLTWLPNPEKDIVGYYIYHSRSPISGFSLANPGLQNGTEFLDTDLLDDTTYYYKIKAEDDAGLVSEESDIVFGKTPAEAKRPVIKKRPSDFAIPEDSYSDSNLNLYDWFADPGSKQLKFYVHGDINIKVTIFPGNGTVALEPKHNWNGREKLTFTAENSAGLSVNDSVTVTVSAVNDPPEGLAITEPGNGTEVKEGRSLNFSAVCTDADLPYGDRLSFTWSSNISGKLGEGAGIRNITLTPGMHLITLEVSDLEKSSLHSEITVSVIKAGSEPEPEPEPEPERNGENKAEGNRTLMFAGMGIIIIVIILVMVLFLYHRRKIRAEDSAIKQPVMKTRPAAGDEPADEDLRYLGTMPGAGSVSGSGTGTEPVTKTHDDADEAYTAPDSVLPPVETPTPVLPEMKKKSGDEE